MTDPLGRPFLELLGEDLAFPATPFAGDGRDAWLQALEAATRADRRAWLRSLEPALLAHPMTRARLTAAERDAARWAGLDDSATFDALIDSIAFHGDSAILARVARGLARLPPTPREAVLSAAVWIGVGLESAGWTSSALLVRQDGTTHERLVVMGPSATARTAVHEAAHVLRAPRREDTTHWPAIALQGELGLKALAATQGWGARLDAWNDAEERACEALTAIWSEDTVLQA